MSDLLPRKLSLIDIDSLVEYLLGRTSDTSSLFKVGEPCSLYTCTESAFIGAKVKWVNTPFIGDEELEPYSIASVKRGGGVDILFRLDTGLVDASTDVPERIIVKAPLEKCLEKIEGFKEVYAEWYASVSEMEPQMNVHEIEEEEDLEMIEELIKLQDPAWGAWA